MKEKSARWNDGLGLKGMAIVKGHDDWSCILSINAWFITGLDAFRLDWLKLWWEKVCGGTIIWKCHCFKGVIRLLLGEKIIG